MAINALITNKKDKNQNFKKSHKSSKNIHKLN